jgi:hypothetical protein
MSEASAKGQWRARIRAGVESRKLRAFLLIEDEKPRRFQMDAKMRSFESEAWRAWRADYVAAYNELSQDDLRWLSEIRAQNDDEP